MLALHLCTLINGIKSCNILSVLQKLTLQMELKNIVTTNVVLDKSKYTTPPPPTTTTKQALKTLVGAENGTRHILQPKRMRYHCTTEST